jgi:pimeloyl-ACP methyl ester carboxylesterase
MWRVHHKDESLNAVRRFSLAATLVLAGLLLPAASANAAFGPCGSGQPAGATCETLTVPLDRSGGVPGDVHLFVVRVAPSQPSKGAVFLLAGGPGQAATPLTSYAKGALAAGLGDRDLIVFDQRGTGFSDPLSCPELAKAGSQPQYDAAVTQCADGLGASRAFYTSRDNADDIEAVRQAIGVDKISLYGVSYGTFTATTYARRYPSHVASLLLDSVVPPTGVDPLDRTTFAAFPRVLRDICAGACRKITKDPVADLATVLGRIRKKRLQATAYSGSGHKITGSIGQSSVHDLLEGADFSPTVRAQIPAALASAAKGDNAPIARLIVDQPATGDQIQTPQPPAQAADSDALFFATECEETAFPWGRTDPLPDRRGELDAALSAAGPSAFTPFDLATAAVTVSSRACLTWPDGSPDSPLVGGPAPDVPVLLLEGADDTRTPIANAEATAALFPQAQLVTVPETGHSVVGTDLGLCASNAVRNFLTGVPAAACPAQQRRFPPSPVPPTRFASVSPARGLHGKPGRTAGAMIDTLNDAVLQATGYALNGAPIAIGGLRGGFMRGTLAGSVVTLKLTRLQYVPGVQLAGTAKIDLSGQSAASARIRISGRSAAHGTLVLRSGAITGTLDGKKVHRPALSASAAPAIVAPRLPQGVLDRVRDGARLRR